MGAIDPSPSTEAPLTEPRGISPSEPPLWAARAFTGGAIALVLIFGGITLLTAVERRSPLARVTDKLLRTGSYTTLGFAWQPEWRLDTLEEPPANAPWRPRNSIRDLDPTQGTVILNLWATWCEPCLQELPSMFRLLDKLSDRPVKMVFVGYDGSWQGPNQLFRQVQGRLPPTAYLIRDPTAVVGGDPPAASLWKRLGATGIPETFFIRDGIVEAKIIGAVDWTQPDIERYVELLADSP